MKREGGGYEGVRRYGMKEWEGRGRGMYRRKKVGMQKRQREEVKEGYCMQIYYYRTIFDCMYNDSLLGTKTTSINNFAVPSVRPKQTAC